MAVLPPDERELPPDPTSPGRTWGFVPEDAPELTREQVALDVLESRLADIRKLLLAAARVRTPLRQEVRALASLAEHLHARVAQERFEAPSP
jgi:hypothetical protein